MQNMTSAKPIKDFPAGSLLLAAYLVVYAIIVATGFFIEYTHFFQSVLWWVVASLMLFSYLEIYNPGGRLKTRRNQRLRIVVVLFLCLLLIVLPTILEMFWRGTGSCDCYVHDSLLQNEAAVRVVAQGKNPYVENYKGTRLESWHLSAFEGLENPALYHYTYMPLTFLLPLPFQVLSENLFNWFDERVLLLVAYLAVLVFCLGFRISPAKKATLLIALGLNPFMAFLIVPGYNDILVLFWVVLCVYALRFDRPYLSAFALALACASKQYAWIFVPFYFFYLGGNGDYKQRILRAWRPILLFSVVFGAITLPWVFDNPSAFFQDVLGYHSGVVLHSYPINGFSLTSLLYAIGSIKKATDTFPSFAIQLVFTVPLLILLLWVQWRENTLPRALLNYAILLAVVIFFARAGNMNHWGYFMAIYLLALLVRKPHEVAVLGKEVIIEQEQPEAVWE